MNDVYVRRDEFEDWLASLSPEYNFALAGAGLPRGCWCPMASCLRQLKNVPTATVTTTQIQVNGHREMGLDDWQMAFVNAFDRKTQTQTSPRLPTTVATALKVLGEIRA